MVAATEHELYRAYQIFKAYGVDVEYLIGYEGDTFGYTGDIKTDILGITSVHPMREDSIKELLANAHADWDIVQKLIQTGALVELDYDGTKFYMRKITGH